MIICKTVGRNMMMSRTAALIVEGITLADLSSYMRT